jgi:WD40 repeat protein
MPSTDTNKNVIGLTNDVTHQFRVAAKTDAVGEWSNVASAKPFAPRLMAMIFDGYYGGHSPIVFEQSGNTFTQVPDATAFPGGTINIGYADAQEFYGAKPLTISSQGDYLATGLGGLPVYSRSGSSFTQLSSLPSLPTATINGVDMQGDYLVAGVSDSAAPLAIYSRSGSTFTRLADPAVLPSAPVRCVSLSADAGYLAVLSNEINNARAISVYARAGSVFSQLTNTTLPAPFAEYVTVRFSPDGNYLVISGQGGVKVYSRTGGTFTDISPQDQPQELGGGSYGRIAFSPNSTIFAVDQQSYYSPGAAVYSISGGVVTRIFQGFPNQPCRGIAFNLDGTLLAAGFENTIQFYAVSGTTVTLLAASTVTLISPYYVATDLEFSWPAT